MAENEPQIMDCVVPPPAPPLVILPRDCEGGAKDGMFKRSVPTGEVLTAALDKLNNASLIKLLGELSEAINSCCSEPPVLPPFPPPGYPNGESWFIQIIATFTKIQTDITNIRVDLSTRIEEIVNVIIDQRIDVRIATSTVIQNIVNTFNLRIEEINVQLKKFTTVINNFFGSSTEFELTLVQIISYINEIRMEINNIHVIFNKYETNFTNINVEITKIWEQINILLKQSYVELVKIVEQHTTQITNIEEQIKLIWLKIQTGGPEPDRKLILNILVEILQSSTYNIQILNSVKININNTSKTLIEILEILARAEYVAEVNVNYNDTDITGVTYRMTDGCVYNFNVSWVNLEGQQFRYIFNANWNGLPATFTMVFRERTNKWTVCKKEVSFTTFEPVQSQNIVFSIV